MADEHFDADHIHTTPGGRHFRHGDGAEVDGEGLPLTETVYVVRDGGGEYLKDGGGRTPASDEAREFRTAEEASAACERTTDRVVSWDAE